MTGERPRTKKRIVFIIAAFLIVAIAIYIFVANQKFADTKEVKADYTVTASELIASFQKDATGANKQYSDKIVTVNGRISELDASADTMVNIKMADTLSGSYIIFAFQSQHAAEAKSLKAGDSISVKGSCSGGNYSDILESTSIEFKRCTLNK